MSQDTIQGFIEAAKPLKEWISRQGHPNYIAIVTSTTCEFLEAQLYSGLIDERSPPHEG